MNIDRRFPPTWSAARDRFYWREWAAVLKADPRANRSALTIKALGQDKPEVEFTDIEFANVIDAFRAISRPTDLLSRVEDETRRKAHLLFVVRRLANRLGRKILDVDRLDATVLDHLRLRLSRQVASQRIAA
jgi:hypothetical protein